MKLARILFSCALAVIPAAACSDPPSPPAQGAVAITVGPGTGCVQAQGGLITAPEGPAGYPDAVNTALLCNLANAGCDPRSYLATDGDNATVACTVSPSGNGFAVSVALVTSPRMSFRASGTLQATGGTLQLTQSGKNFQGNALNDPACQITIQPNIGTIQAGAIWARFNCTSFTDPNAAGDGSCTAQGEFYFDHCNK